MINQLIIITIKALTPQTNAHKNKTKQQNNKKNKLM